MLLRQVKLTNFCGVQSCAADVGQFTTLVGPNNGGKTTLLRAIEFALTAFRMYFGDGDEAQYNQLSGNWHVALTSVATRLGVQDRSSFCFGRTQAPGTEVLLTFHQPQGEIRLS